MSDSYSEFQDRVAHIYAKHEKGPRLRKVSRYVDRDGYVVIRGRAPRRSVPWAGLIMIAAAFFGVKGTMIATMGNDFYNSKVSKLEPANIVERAAAWTMQPDPLSRWIALQIKSLR